MILSSAQQCSWKTHDIASLVRRADGASWLLGCVQQAFDNDVLELYPGYLCECRRLSLAASVNRGFYKLYPGCLLGVGGFH
jgi:hypothetical protein